MSAIPAALQRLFKRLERSQADSSSSENSQVATLPLPALTNTAAADTSTVALCARCRRELRRNSFKVRAGRARARIAQRDARGRFVKQAAALALVAGFLLAPPTFAQSETKTFTAPDGSFSFRYWNGLVQCHPPKDGYVWEPPNICSAYVPVCDGLLVGEQYGVACFAYPRNKFTNTPAFEAATFSVEVLGSKKSDKSCLKPDDPDFEERTGATTINGVVFTTFDFGEALMNQGTSGTAYLAFYKGKCYQLGINFATANDPEDYDPPIRKLTDKDIDEVNTKLKQALESFRFLK